MTSQCPTKMKNLERQDGAFTRNGLKNTRLNSEKKNKLVLRTKFYSSKCDIDSDASRKTKEKGDVHSLQFNPTLLCISPRNFIFGNPSATNDFSLLSLQKWLEKRLCLNLSDDIGDNDCTNTRDVCAICMCPIKDGDKVAVIPCNCLRNHFHSKCLKQWLQRKNQCPLCQTPNIASPLHINQEKYVELYNEDCVKHANKNTSSAKKTLECPENNGISSHTTVLKPKNNDMIVVKNNRVKKNTEKIKSFVEINKNPNTPTQTSQISTPYSFKNISPKVQLDGIYDNPNSWKRVAVPSKNWKKNSYNMTS